MFASQCVTSMRFLVHVHTVAENDVRICYEKYGIHVNCVLSISPHQRPSTPAAATSSCSPA